MTVMMLSFLRLVLSTKKTQHNLPVDAYMDNQGSIQNGTWRDNVMKQPLEEHDHKMMKG
jgi:hypothetical protein